MIRYHHSVETQPSFELKGSLELDDMVRYQYFHALRRTWPLVIFAALVLLLAVPTYVLSEIADPNHDWSATIASAFPLICLLLFWLCVLCIMPWRNAKKLVATQSHFCDPVTYTFTDETISGVGPNVQWTMAWNILKRVSETKSLFLLYHGPNIAVIVPKRFFQNSADVENWRQFVVKHLDAKAIEKPAFVARQC